MNRQFSQLDALVGFNSSTKFAGVVVASFVAIAVGFIAFSIKAAFEGPSSTGDANSVVYASVVDDLFGPTDSDSVVSTGQSSAEQRFALLIEPIRAARAVRLALGEATKQSIDSSLYEIASSVNASEFADNVLGLDSTFQLFQGSGSHEQWLMGKFETYLIDIDDVTQIISARFRELASQILEVDQRLLVYAGYPSEYVPSSNLESIDAVLPLVSAAWQVVDKAESMATYAPLELVSTTALGGIVGFLAGQAATDMGKTNDDGSPTQSAQNIGTGVGMAAGFVSEYVAKEVIGSARSLKQSAETTLFSALNAMRLNGGEEYRWTTAIDNYVQSEQQSVEGILINFFGISPEKASIESR